MEYKGIFVDMDFSSNRDEIIKQLLDENRLLKRMLDRASDGIFIADGREENYGNSIYCNPVLLNLLGVQEEEVIGRNVVDYKNEFVINNATFESMRTKKPETVIQTMKRTNRKALVTSTPVYNVEGNLQCFFVQIRDLVKFEEILTNKEIESHKIKPCTSTGVNNAFLEAQQPFIAEDPAMLQVLQLAKLLAQFDTGILLTGETGVGKEVVAKFIHENSTRKRGPFVTVNCATFQRELVESELFGYESGAFTGAKRTGKIGLFEAAKDGTLFLDEINSLPYDMQGKLLRVIETKKIRAVGGNKEHEIDFRLIAATNEPLETLTRNREFREDLYYRINAFSIDIPALRERKGDIRPLLEHFTGMYADKYGIDFQLTKNDIERAQEYSWPGNVRELRNFAEQLVVIGSARLLDAKNNKVKDEKEIEKLIGNGSGTLKERLEECERVIIKETLKKFSFKRDAAKELGIDPAVLSRKISKFNL